VHWSESGRRAVALRRQRWVALALVTLGFLGCSSDDGPGQAGSGGSTSASGGVMASGGQSSAGAGGTVSTGGARSSGGVTSSGGAPAGGAATGGTQAASGAPATGGSSGGTVSSGGSSLAGSGGAAGSGAPTGGSVATGGKAAGGAGSAECDATSAVATMKLGWNLGNSLDSVDASKSDATVETAWGNPLITPQLIDAVADAGFGVVRIPVTWIDRMGAAPEHLIHAAFIERVEQVVNYVLDRGLYAIINLHHDGAEGMTGQWITLVDGSGQVTEANSTQVRARFKTVWTQLAAHFEGYGERLIFESMNELKVGYDQPLASYLALVNDLNQDFVDTVRAGSGNNRTRCLVVPGYNTNIDHTLTGFVRPVDLATGKLILSAHYYDPWSFAGAATTQYWGGGTPDDWGQEDWVLSQVAKLKTTYIDQGLPVIWGEYGAVHQAGYENYRRYYLEYVTKATHDAGIAPIYWDNGGENSGEDGFALFRRSDNSVLFPEILQAMQRAVTSDYALEDVAKP
jgi:endoglucanase